MHSDDSEAAAGTASPPGHGIQVTPEQLLAAAKIIEAQANTLADRLVAAEGSIRVDAPAHDVVSVHVVEVWNTLVTDGDEALLPRAMAYLDSVRALAARLRAAAGGYTGDEEMSVAGFADHGIG